MLEVAQDVKSRCRARSTVECEARRAGIWVGGQLRPTMQLVAVEKGGAAEPNRSRRSCNGFQRCKTRERERCQTVVVPPESWFFFVGRSLLFVLGASDDDAGNAPRIGEGAGDGGGGGGGGIILCSSVYIYAWYEGICCVIVERQEERRGRERVERRGWG